MKRQDIVNFLFTFVMGFVVGVYVYFAGFAPTTAKIENAVEDIGQTLIVTAEAYGGCERAANCPSFNVQDDGTYRYAFYPRGATERVIREGSLPLQLQQRLQRYATQNALATFSAQFDPVVCESDNGGTDIRYDIVLEDELYQLDSCGTAIDSESRLWQTLNEVWDYFQTGG